MVEGQSGERFAFQIWREGDVGPWFEDTEVGLLLVLERVSDMVRRRGRDHHVVAVRVERVKGGGRPVLAACAWWEEAGRR